MNSKNAEMSLSYTYYPLSDANTIIEFESSPREAKASTTLPIDSSTLSTIALQK